MHTPLQSLSLFLRLLRGLRSVNPDEYSFMAIIDLIMQLTLFTTQHSSLLINSKKPNYLSYQSVQQIIIMTLWYLNFCAPFLYDTSGTPQTIRYILHISLIIEFLTYVFFIAKYKLFGQQIPVRNEINIGNEYEDGLHLKKYTVSFAGMGDRQYRLDQKKFKEWYLHYFGLHSIAVAGCIMYSPYTATAVFALLQTALFLVATGMHSCVIEGTTKVVYYVVMVCVVILEVLLLFSLSMGVGASGYDLATRNCYLLQ